MARDSLRILLSVRQHAVEQSRQALGACLSAEAVLADRIRSLDDAARRDREMGGTWEDGLQFHEMAAIRLVTMRAVRLALTAELAAAEGRSAVARTTVTAARAAAEAVEQLIEERQAASATEASRREQHALDDTTRTRHVGRRRAAVAE